MNSDSSELETSSNSRPIFLPPNSTRLPTNSSNVVTYHSMSTTDAGCEVSANNELTTNLTNNINITVAKNVDKPQERYVWEMRSRSPNVTPASTVLNSPDMNTDMQYTLQHHNRQHHQIRVGRSPGSQFEQHNILPQGLASPGSPTDVGKADGQCLRDGEIVVFDDIDTNWMNKTNSNNSKENIQHLQHNNEDILKVTKMIGQLPIAEYEGSPRRFGNQPQTKQTNTITGNAFPKRPPGFPQRVSPLSTAQQLQLHQQQEANVRQLIQQQQQQQQQQAQQYYQQNATNIATGVTNPNEDLQKSIGNLIDIDNDGCVVNNTKAKTPTFDYLYEFSETRKVLEEFFKVSNQDDEKRFTDYTESDEVGSCDTHQEYEKEREEEKHIEQAYIGQRLARIPKDELYMVHRSPRKQNNDNVYSENNEIELYIDSNSRSSGDLADTELEANLRRHSRNFTLSPETTDYDSNCGDLDSLSNDINCTTDYGKLYTSMPVLEDGLSSGHASDTENNGMGLNKTQQHENIDNIEKGQQLQYQQQQQQQQQLQQQQMIEQNEYNASLGSECNDDCRTIACSDMNIIDANFMTDLVNGKDECNKQQHCNDLIIAESVCCNTATLNNSNELSNDLNYEAVYAAAAMSNKQKTPPPPPAPVPHRQQRLRQQRESADIQEAMKEIRSALQRAKTQPEKLKFCDEVLPPDPESPVWVPRNSLNNIVNSNHSTTQKHHCTGEEEEPDTDLETDRLLGQQRLDDQDFFDDKTIWPKTSRIGMHSNDHSPSTSDVTLLTSNSNSIKPQTYSSATIRQGIGTSLTPTSPDRCQIVGSADVALTSPEKLQFSKSPTGSIKSLKDSANSDKKAKTRNKEGLLDPLVLIEGVLFRARYLGSTQLVCEGQPTKSTRMMQAEEAVSRIKAPEGESQPSTEVDLFISTEKIMVLNTDLKEIMMDHALRTISYIADIGDLVVLMARRRFVPSDSCSSDAEGNGCTTTTTTNANGNKETKENGGTGSSKLNRTPKMICHVFESDEAQFIAQSIGQAFQVAYMEFLKANGIEDHSFVKEMDYQEVLNSQEIFGDELEIFAKKELQKEVVVPKAKGEILGVVIVESGWGSMLPTVVIANLMSAGAAARCGQLNIGDQLIAINGMSLVGLPLSTCQSYIRNAKNQTAVKFTVVPCPPVVEVKIKRPNTKYQLGFSVQNGVICSLLRGGIAERGGVRVGHRIIEINNQSVVAVPHEKIVNLLATSVGEILMKTMPTSMFRLLTGQENPIYI
ncbi:uncharacterized protein LOC119670974 isoform X2 [Teleopsis dalmanni]|uniref:uncharacterized protein LOC119670974 isoform X2 n=1 Tax=Teleopsis dalmanni TaxID=139649 RepID=UPI0018CD4A1B|nr:uncharacterized protein LOC119670974 isoform X2 [Teleopsis dalmanni]